MDKLTLAALLLNFGAVAGAMVMRISIERRSIPTFHVGGLLSALGTIAGFGAAAIFLYNLGVLHGLLYWAGSAIAFTAITSTIIRIDALITILGLLSIVLGGGLAVYGFV